VPTDDDDVHRRDVIEPSRRAGFAPLTTPGEGGENPVKGAIPTEEALMVLSTAKIEDFDRFWQTFSTKGAELRKQRGSKGAQAFRDPNDADRVWVVFDWSPEEFKEFISSPEAQEVFKEGGLQGPPEPAEAVGETES
jgi:heme-degrading monooxygenase HmoA